MKFMKKRKIRRIASLFMAVLMVAALCQAVLLILKPMIRPLNLGS